MKIAKATVLSLIMVLGVAVAADAFARGRHHHHHGGVRFGVFVGAPAYWGGWGYPGPYYYGYGPYYPSYYPSYYYPRAYVEQPVYVEQGQTQAPAQGLQPGYWYFCRESNAYYPHVNQCAGRWEQVAPQPPSQ